MAIRRGTVAALLAGLTLVALAGCSTTVTNNGAAPTPTLTQVPYASPSATAGPVTQLTVLLSGCEGCYLIAYHSVRGTSLSSDSGIVAAVVKNGAAHLTVQTAYTHGLALALKNIPGGYTSKVGVPYVVMGFGGTPPDTKITQGLAAGTRTGSWCWAGTDASNFTMTLASARYVVSGQPDHIISVWASPSLQVPIVATNLTLLYKGGIGLVGAPYCD